LRQLVFQGKVYTGTGQGKKFVSLPWVKQQIEEKLGFSPYAGTLNIHLTTESAKRRLVLETAEGIEITPEAGFYAGELFLAKIGSVCGAVVVPKVLKYPGNVLEIIAPVCLRQRLKLTDGNTVSVTVDV
jgi:riboflavin kinase, archaea type